MRMIISGAAKVVGVALVLLIAYNAVIFAEVARGKHMEYIPWLHFPIKILVALMG